MKVKLYAVLDTASAIYDGPIPAQTDELAVRNFGNMARDIKHPIGKNPEYFSLWVVGEWDDSKGEVIHTKTECLVKAIDLLTPTEVS